MLNLLYTFWGSHQWTVFDLKIVDNVGLLMVFLFAIALTNRINIIRNEKELAQNQAIENLHRSDQLKNDFLANTSHELKTPLNGILGIVESFVDGVTGHLNTNQKTLLTMVYSNGKRLYNLVNDILDFSKLRHKDLQLNQKSVDMRSLTNSILSISQSLTANKTIQIKNNIPENAPLVYADENRVTQVMYNLLGNALKYTDSGQIEISSKEMGDYLEISVSDTGIVISQNNLNRIFESFEQGDSSVVREHGGTGLGLPISKYLIELHGRAINVQSEINKGFCFSFTLPLYKGDDKEAETQSEITKILSYTDENIYQDMDIKIDQAILREDHHFNILIVQ